VIQKIKGKSKGKSTKNGKSIPMTKGKSKGKNTKNGKGLGKGPWKGRAKGQLNGHWNAGRMPKNVGLPGLFLLEEFVDAEKEKYLISEIDDKGVWNNSRCGKRRVQLAGPFRDGKYKIDSGKASTPHPGYSNELKRKIVKLIRRLPNQLGMSDADFKNFMDDCKCQLVINEYYSGQELLLHFDHHQTYGPVIVGLSLQGAGVLTFQHGKTGQEIDVPLPPRSLYLMSGDSRYVWMHGMTKGRGSTDRRRVSLTWRNVGVKAA